MGLNLFSLSGLVLSLTCVVLLFLIMKFGKSNLHRIWALFNISLIIWGGSAFLIGSATSEAKAFFYWKIAHIGIILIPILFFHVIYFLCELNQKKVLIAMYVQGVIFLVLNFLGYKDLFFSDVKTVYQSFYYFTPGPLYYLFFVLWVGIVIYGIYQLYFGYRNSVRGIKRTQILYFFLGISIGFTGGLTNFFPIFSINLYPLGNFAIPLYCIIATYAILRYRLMDINLVFRKGMVYSLSAGLLTSLFVVLVLTLTKYLSDVTGVTSLIITIISALIIAILFQPLKNRVQKIIDKTFYQKAYDYYEALREVSRRLSTIFEIDKINEFIATTIHNTLGVSKVYVLAAASSENYEIAYQTKERGKRRKALHDFEDNPLQTRSRMVFFMVETRDTVIKDELPAFAAEIGSDRIDMIKRELETFRAEAAVPVFIDGELPMLLMLGEKLSGDMFTREDINLLNTIAGQMAIAVKNAALYKDKLNTEKLASIGMMSATFAHEVRNPLTSLKTFAQLMPEKYNDEEFREGFSKIVVGEIQRIDDLISDLLDFSHERKASRVYAYDLVGIVDETIQYVEGKLGLARKHIVVEKKYTRDAIHMYGDVKQLRQLFTNIITNGCQAIDENGVLTIEINPNGKNVEIKIKDTGPGIHPDDLHRIFEPFVTKKEKGTGLGLAISKKIVEEHSGSIRVESRLSEGSSFIVSLPVQNE